MISETKEVHKSLKNTYVPSSYGGCTSLFPLIIFYPNISRSAWSGKNNGCCLWREENLLNSKFLYIFELILTQKTYIPTNDKEIYLLERFLVHLSEESTFLWFKYARVHIV